MSGLATIRVTSRVVEAAQFLARNRPSYWVAVHRAPATDIVRLPWKRKHKWTTADFRAKVLTWLRTWLSTRPWVSRWRLAEIAFSPGSLTRLEQLRLLLTITRKSDGHEYEVCAEFKQDDVVDLNTAQVAEVFERLGTVIDDQAT